MEKVQKQVAAFIKENLNFDDYKVTLTTADEILVRYAQNMITQNISGIKHSVNISVMRSGKEAQTTINSFEQQSLISGIKELECKLEGSLVNSEYVESNGMIELPKVKNCCDSTLNCNLADIEVLLAKILDNSISKDRYISGFTTRVIRTINTFTKNGFEASEVRSVFSNSMTMAKDGKETKVVKSVKSFKDFDVDSESRYN